MKFNYLGGYLMYQFHENMDAKKHDQFIKKQVLCNLLQSSDWAKVKENWDNEIIGVTCNDELVASAMVLIKKLPLGFTMMYTPRGPIMDYKNKDLVSFFMKEMKKWAKKKRCLFVKMDPAIHYKDYKIGETNVEINVDVETVLRNMKAANAIHQGFTTYIEESIQPRYQANVYAKDDFIETLPRHTRRLIKDALKRDVKVVRVGKERMQEFADVVALTEKRKQVSLRNQEYFYQLMDIYQDDCYLFLAEVDIAQTLQRLRDEKEKNDAEIAKTVQSNSPKKIRRLEDIKRSLDKDLKEFEEYIKLYSKKIVIAGVLSIRMEDTLEMLYAGMNDQFKKFMPQYYLYTEIMKYAFEQGCKYANMGGVEGDLQDGLTKFKSNFDPFINEFIGEFDLPVNTLLYHLSQKAYEIRKKALKKRK